MSCVHSTRFNSSTFTESQQKGKEGGVYILCECQENGYLKYFCGETRSRNRSEGFLANQSKKFP